MKRLYVLAGAALALAACSNGQQSNGIGGAAAASNLAGNQLSVADDACADVDRTLSPEQRRAETERLTALAGMGRALEVEAVLRQGEWTAVIATPVDAERGVYFIRTAPGAQAQLVETWGGSGPASERPEIAAWAQALPGSPPRELSQCFATMVTG